MGYSNAGLVAAMAERELDALIEDGAADWAEGWTMGHMLTLAEIHGYPCTEAEAMQAVGLVEEMVENKKARMGRR